MSLKEAQKVEGYRDEGEETPIAFSGRATENLKRAGFIVYSLNGETIADLQEVGRQIVLPDVPVTESVREYRARMAQVAINPTRFLEEKPTELGIPGIREVCGRVADLSSLGFQHFEQTGEDIFGGKYARTQEWVGGVLLLGIRFTQLGVQEVIYRHPSEGFENSWTPTIVVPAGAK